MSTRTTSLRLRLASAALMFILAAPACRSDDGQPPDGTTGGEPTLQTSRAPNLQWKRAAAVEHDLERALALTRDQLCLEVGVAPCVEQVHLVEGEGPTRQLLGAPQRLGLAVAEVVDHHDLVAGLEEFHRGVAADEAGAAGHEDPHLGAPP